MITENQVFIQIHGPRSFKHRAALIRKWTRSERTLRLAMCALYGKPIDDVELALFENCHPVWFKVPIVVQSIMHPDTAVALDVVLSAYHHTNNAGKWKERARNLAKIIYPFCYGSYNFEPSWVCSTAQTLANDYLLSKNLTILPLLSDVLQDNGCSDPQVIGDLQTKTYWPRGCYLLDAITGRLECENGL